MGSLRDEVEALCKAADFIWDNYYRYLQAGEWYRVADQRLQNLRISSERVRAALSEAPARPSDSHCPGCTCAGRTVSHKACHERDVALADLLERLADRIPTPHRYVPDPRDAIVDEARTRARELRDGK